MSKTCAHSERIAITFINGPCDPCGPVHDGAFFMPRGARGPDRNPAQTRGKLHFRALKRISFSGLFPLATGATVPRLSLSDSSAREITPAKPFRSFDCNELHKAPQPYSKARSAAVSASLPAVQKRWIARSEEPPISHVLKGFKRSQPMWTTAQGSLRQPVATVLQGRRTRLLLHSGPCG